MALPRSISCPPSWVLALALAGCRGQAAAEAEVGSPSSPPSDARATVLSATASARPLDREPVSPASSTPSDPENRSKPPLTSADLDERAQHLFQAVVRGDPALADDFFFPKAPFVPLKDVADPGRYFDQLLAAYHRDVLTLRKSEKSWEGAAFVSFELGTPPRWVAPGEEYNKIGYYRTFHGKLRYKLGDKPRLLDVTTIISWDGQWYVTHLGPIRH